MPSFVRYWAGAGAATPSPEGRIVEREALAQIWPTLTELERRAVLAFAAHGSAEVACVALGMTRRAFLSRLNAARARFRTWWHEGETPSVKWRPDSATRDGKRTLRPCGHPSTYTRHRRRGEPVDDACRQAWTAYQAERKAAREGSVTKSE
jgi:hypothetical protein